MKEDSRCLMSFLEISGQVGAEKEFLHQMERKVEKPFHYEWVEGWSTLLGSMVADLGVVMALFLGIVLSSLFAGEWHDNTSTLVLTTRNGWGKIALAKILTGFAFTVELFALLAVSSIISQLFFYGNCRMGYADSEYQADCCCTYEYAAGRNL